MYKYMVWSMRYRYSRLFKYVYIYIYRQKYTSYNKARSTDDMHARTYIMFTSVLIYLPIYKNQQYGCI